MSKLNPEITLGFLIATLLWIGILGWQASYAPTDSEKRQCEETAGKEGRKTEECKSLWERTTSDPVAFFTFWLVVFTGGLGVSTVLLWRAGERQIELVRETSVAQSRDMKASVAAAEAAVNVAQDTAKRQLRAYVTVNGVIRTRDPGDLNGEGFAVLIDVKNNGQTPASDLLQWARIEIREFPLATDLPIHCLENAPRGILPPETKNLAFPTFTRALTIIEENAVLANHTAVYVYGEVDYLDVFGDRHLTQFRFRCNGQGYGLGMFKADSEGNNAS